MRPLFIAVGVVSALSVVGVLGWAYLASREEGDFFDLEPLPSGTSYAGSL